jgi:hypothetical protein
MSASAQSNSTLPTPGYASCRTKRSRASKAEMMQRRAAIYEIVELIQPCSVRQAFYQTEIKEIVEKTERGYEKVQRAIVWLRQNEYVPFAWISDATRWMRKPQSFSSIEAALRETVETYRRAVWRDENVYVEFWLEKDALAGTIYDVTREYDAPLMVARGYSSLTFLHSAADAIKNIGKPAYIYHLGDWDPSGQNAADHIERKLREYAPGVPIHFEKLAVTEQQIIDWKLPTRPTKTSDSRSKNWKGDSVELDAIDPNILRQLVRDRIERHISPQRLAVIEAAEQSEREAAAIWLTIREAVKTRNEAKGGTA